MSNIKGYMDEHYEPVFDIVDYTPDSVRQFMYKHNLANNEVDDDDGPHHVVEEKIPPHGYQDYIQSKAKYKTNTVEMVRDENGTPIRAFISTKEVSPNRIPIYICKSRISLGIDRQLDHKHRIHEWDRKTHHSVDLNIEGEEEERMIFRMRHDISHDWLREVCDDSIEL